MRRSFERLSFVLVLLVASFYAWKHVRHAAVALVPAPAAPENHTTYSEEQEASQDVTVVSPLADYLAHHKPLLIQTPLEPVAYKRAETDLVDPAAASPVGTSRPLLKQTFRISGVADLPFEVPAHAATPQLRGTYHCFLQNADASEDDEAKVEFLLLNEPQYADLLNGRPSEALFSAEGMHDGEVNVSLPPTLSRAVKYYLIFRADPIKAGKQAVQADFRLDF
jgi:hypothetical protein